MEDRNYFAIFIMVLLLLIFFAFLPSYIDLMIDRGFTIGKITAGIVLYTCFMWLDVWGIKILVTGEM
jgi:hypothetical protein